MKKFLIFLAVATCSIVNSQVSIFPDDPGILYTGRFSFNDPLNPSFSLNGVNMKINFEGTKVTGRFSSEGGASFIYVIIDGNADPHNRKVLEINGVNESQFTLVENLEEGSHTLELVKLNESDTKVTFHGFVIDGYGLKNTPDRPPLQLEFIGDSNTAGWSAWNAYDEGGNSASGAYFTFPGITSRLLKAEFSLIGGGGSGVTDGANWNLTKFYDRIHRNDPPTDLNIWNFKDNYWGFSPAAIIVNLGANDYYPGTPKQEIKGSWKKFITEKLRKKYPEAHIVLANSYGWAYGEPADYVHEAIEELKASGDENISFVRFPWLWGQQHAVINEHAGFANILADHLAQVLNLPKPQHSNLSSFVNKGELYNGGFEKSILPGIADGWRPHGKNQLIHDSEGALGGSNFLRLENNGWVNYPATVVQGTTLKLSGWGRADDDTNSGFLKIEFKDQGQKTIKTQQIQPDFTKNWKKYETTVVVPEGVWSAWVVLQAAESSTIDFDDISLEIIASTEDTGENNVAPTDKICIYPNPTDTYLNINMDTVNENYEVNVFSIDGTFVDKLYNADKIFVSTYNNGMYLLQIPQRQYLAKFIKY